MVTVRLGGRPYASGCEVSRSTAARGGQVIRAIELAAVGVPPLEVAGTLPAIAAGEFEQAFRWQ